MNTAKLTQVVAMMLLNLMLLSFADGADAAPGAYPQKSIIMIVPFPPGGSADIVARVIAKPLAEMLGQSVVIENKPGADGAVAAEAATRADADGHTLFMATYGAMSAVPALHKHVSYDVSSDFTPITTTGRFAFFLFVHPGVPAKTLAEFIKYAQAHPGKLNYGTGNAGSILAMAELASVAKLDLLHIPYKGEVPAMSDFITGRIQVMFATPSNALNWVQEGKLRALVTLLDKRSPLLPEVPTMTEAGMGELAIVPWAGLFGPSKMARPVTDALSKAVNTILLREDVRAEFARQGFEAAGSTPEQLGAYVKDQLKVWRGAIKTAGIIPE